jgi:hypothetical protein
VTALWATFKFSAPDTDGASNVKLYILVPTIPLTVSNDVALTPADTELPVKHVTVVAVVHPEVAQLLSPREAVRVKSFAAKLRPKIDVDAPPVTGELLSSGWWVLITGAL